MTDHVSDSLNFPGDDETLTYESERNDELTEELITGLVGYVTVQNMQGDTTYLQGTVEDDWTPMRSDAAEIEYRFAQSTQRLRDLRAQKANLFELIREEVIANNRLARAARIFNIELEGDDGDDGD